MIKTKNYEVAEIIKEEKEFDSPFGNNNYFSKINSKTSRINWENDLKLKKGNYFIKNGRIKIFAKPEKIELHKSISMGTILSKLSNNENDSLILEKTDIKSLLKNIRAPELIIQSSYNGYSYRKKFNEKKGIKYKLIKEKKSIFRL